jgi:hypothetical protein
MAAITLSTFILALRLKADRDGKTPKEVAEAILLGQFSASVVNGRTVIRTSEAGGSTEFALPTGLTPAEVMELAAEAIRRNVTTTSAPPQRTRRLRVCFDRASL